MLITAVLKTINAEWLNDLKHEDNEKHKKFTGAGNKIILSNKA